MIEVTYNTSAGESRPVAVEPGMSLMEAAVLNSVDGIVAECGGGCSCATCHVYVDERWLDRFEEPAPEESDLLEFLDGVKNCSRLSCQLLLQAEHDGLSVTTPPFQA